LGISLRRGAIGPDAGFERLARIRIAAPNDLSRPSPRKKSLPIPNFKSVPRSNRFCETGPAVLSTIARYESRFLFFLDAQPPMVQHG